MFWLKKSEFSQDTVGHSLTPRTVSAQALHSERLQKRDADDDHSRDPEDQLGQCGPAVEVSGGSGLTPLPLHGSTP